MPRTGPVPSACSGGRQAPGARGEGDRTGEYVRQQGPRPCAAHDREPRPRHRQNQQKRPEQGGYRSRKGRGPALHPPGRPFPAPSRCRPRLPGSAPGGPSFGPSSRRRPLPPCRRPLCLRAITGPPGRHRCPRAVAAATPTPHPGSRPPPPRPRAAGGRAVLSPVVPVPALVVPVPALVVRASPRLGPFRPVGGSVPVRPVRPAGPWRRDRGDRRISGPWETVARGDVTQGEPRVNSGGRPGMFEHLATMTESARR